MRKTELPEGALRTKLANGLQRLQRDGLLSTAVFYFGRISGMFFSRWQFGRWDLNVKPDLRTGGMQYMHIGKHFTMGRGGWLECITEYENEDGKQVFQPNLVIGDNVNIGEFVHIGCNHHIEIGDNVLTGSKIYITDHNHGVYKSSGGGTSDSPYTPPGRRQLTEHESVIIGDNVWLGEFVTVLPGVTIGAGSIIGSHATVTHDIPPNSIAVGSPARVIKQWNPQTVSWERVQWEVMKQ